MAKIGRRIYELDVFRGLAAISVVLFHYTSHYKSYVDESIVLTFRFDYGWLGVHLFFMISGFVIYMTLSKTERPIQFIHSRFTRLFPAYWAAVILTFVIVQLGNLQSIKVSSVEALVNLTMLQELFGARHVDYVYWTLFVELLFYIYSATAYFLLKKIKIEYILIFWLALQAIYLVAEHYHIAFPWKITKYFILQYIHLFAAGIVFYKIYSDKIFLLNRTLILASVIVLQFASFGWLPGISVLIFYLMFYLLIMDKLAIIKNEGLIWLGNISYCLYLLHQFIGFVVIHQLMALGLGHTASALLTLMGVLVFAHILHKKVEQPILRYMRNRLRN